MKLKHGIYGREKHPIGGGMENGVSVAVRKGSLQKGKGYSTAEIRASISSCVTGWFCAPMA